MYAGLLLGGTPKQSSLTVQALNHEPHWLEGGKPGSTPKLCGLHSFSKCLLSIYYVHGTSGLWDVWLAPGLEATNLWLDSELSDECRAFLWNGCLWKVNEGRSFLSPGAA